VRTWRYHLWEIASLALVLVVGLAVCKGADQPIGNASPTPGLPNVGSTPIPGLYATPEIVVPTP
jgi:hypothetical protein